MAADTATSAVPAIATLRPHGDAFAVLRSSLIDGLERLGIDASPRQLDALLDFLALLSKWGRVYNLTAVRDAQDMLAIHLLDSLSILPSIDRLSPSSILDVGSGAGLPSIPLSILRPNLEIVSVDAVAKKIGFQIQVKTALRLGGLKPMHARVEALCLDRVPSVIVSRAYATLATMLVSVAHLAGPSTTILAMKGIPPRDESAALPAAWTVDDVISLDVPHLGAERCLVVLRRAVA